MPVWNELFKQDEFRWKEPHEQVVALAPLLRARGACRVLDLGCGAGRHLVYLAREGFEMHGMDVAENGLAHARQWLEGENLRAELLKSDMGEIPYADAFFDAVLCLCVIYHQKLEGMRRVVAEIHRVLQPHGLALVSLLSKRGYRYRQGEEIGPDTFITNVGPDRGIPHHYSDLAEIESLFERFAIRKIEMEEKVFEGKGLHTHWHVLAEKE